MQAKLEGMFDDAMVGAAEDDNNVAGEQEEIKTPSEKQQDASATKVKDEIK